MFGFANATYAPRALTRNAILRCRPPKCVWRRVAAARASLSGDSRHDCPQSRDFERPSEPSEAQTLSHRREAPHDDDPTEVSAQLLACAAYIGPVALNKLAAALELCFSAGLVVAHRNVAVARTCAELKMDCQTLCAAVLRGLCSVVDKTRIENAAGSAVLHILDVYGQLDDVGRSAQSACSEDALAPYRCAALRASADEPRALALQLASALHAARTKQLAAEHALYLYAPLAERAALWQVQCELEERAFRILQPVEHRRTRNAMATRIDAPKELLNDTRRELEAALPRDAAVRAAVARARVVGRIKGVYSFYRKMQRGKALDDIYDLLALRVIVTPRGARNADERAACYAVAAAIRERYALVAQREKDYVARPKPNGYRALHLTVLVGNGARRAPLEVQIRTEKMHHVAEFGSAAPRVCAPPLCAEDDADDAGR